MPENLESQEFRLPMYTAIATCVLLHSLLWQEGTFQVVNLPELEYVNDFADVWGERMIFLSILLDEIKTLAFIDGTKWGQDKKKKTFTLS